MNLHTPYRRLRETQTRRARASARESKLGGNAVGVRGVRAAGQVSPAPYGSSALAIIVYAPWPRSGGAAMSAAGRAQPW